MYLFSHEEVYYQASTQVFSSYENKLITMHTQVGTPAFESTSSRSWVQKYCVEKCQGVRVTPR